MSLIACLILLAGGLAFLSMWPKVSWPVLAFAVLLLSIVLWFK